MGGHFAEWRKRAATRMNLLVGLLDRSSTSRFIRLIADLNATLRCFLDAVETDGYCQDAVNVPLRLEVQFLPASTIKLFVAQFG